MIVLVWLVSLLLVSCLLGLVGLVVLSAADERWLVLWPGWSASRIGDG